MFDRLMVFHGGVFLPPTERSVFEPGGTRQRTDPERKIGHLCLVSRWFLVDIFREILSMIPIFVCSDLHLSLAESPCRSSRVKLLHNMFACSCWCSSSTQIFTSWNNITYIYIYSYMCIYIYILRNQLKCLCFYVLRRWLGKMGYPQMDGLPGKIPFRNG